jgi:hypothetical protein
MANTQGGYTHHIAGTLCGRNQSCIPVLRNDSTRQNKDSSSGYKKVVGENRSPLSL